MFVENIRVFHGRRALHEGGVQTLTKSLSMIGLREPITVRVIPELTSADGTIVEDAPVLVAGAHRLEAARRLGWEMIDVFVLEGDDRDARLWELAENLHRSDLSEAERREQIAEWVRITEEKLPHNAAVSRRGHIEGRGNEGAICQAARDLGISKDTVARAVAAESLCEDAKAAADTAGLGTLTRAKISRLPSAHAQTAAVLREKELADARKANRLTDQIVAERRLGAVKEWLSARLDVTEMHDLGEMLAGICAPLSRALLREAA